jgi:ergothioneine biosynthesis protein EgtB
MSLLFDRFVDIRKYTETIFKPLAIEDYVVQPIAFASPPKWNLGHTSWFFETFILQQFSPEYKTFDPGFSFVFNSYYNNVGDRVVRHNRGDLTRPTVEEIYRYRQYVNEAMENFMIDLTNPKVIELIELGLQHEQQHQELFWTDLKYTLSLNPLNVKYPGPLPFETFDETADAKFLKVAEGVYEVGFEGDGFSYDNEHNRHKVYLQNFEISNRLITNGEFIEFIEDGSYRDFNYWHDEGWKWVNDHQITAPLYWQKIDNKWYYYTLTGMMPVNPDLPVSHISFYEAYAFAEWKGARLATEFEWEIASGKFNWGQRWEWTNSAYLPYPGFFKAKGAVGEYNGKFMVSQMVLRGASVATSPGHSRKTYRNFFHPWERWQFTGIRLVK